MRPRIVFTLLLAALLAVTACTSQPAPTATNPPAASAPAQAPTSIPPTVAPTAAPEVKTEERTLTVLAAASLTESFTEIGAMFEAQYPGSKAVFSFAGSQQLAQQLAQGAEADVFASASKKYMDAAIEAKRANKDDAKTFAKNRLVVIVPKGNPGELKELKDLAKPGIKLDLADKSVPVGQYSLDFLDKAVKDPAFGDTFKDDVIKNVVSYEDNVKSVLTKVSLGEADAGIVYVTDITPSAADRVEKIDIPDELNTIATYPIAPISDSKNADLARAFVELVLSADGQSILSRYGFVTIGSESASSGSYTVTDALGRNVTFNQPPQKIVLAGKALIMVADAIYLFPEAGPRIAALGSTAQGSGDFIPLIDPDFGKKITLDKDAGPEQIAAAQPDCVIMKSSNAKKLGTSLEELKIPVVYVDFETPEQYERDLKTLGVLFQNPDRAAKIAAFYQGQVDAISKVVSAVPDEKKPRTLILYYSDKDGAVAFNVPPMSWMQSLMVQIAGGKPVWEDANPVDGWTKVSLEQVAAWNPDVIFIVAYFNPVDDVVKNLKSDAQWQALEAVKNNRVYGFATDLYSWDQPDSRWILGLAWTAGKLYPDLFADLDIHKTAQTFYSEMYGMDEAWFQKNILPVMSGDIQ